MVCLRRASRFHRIAADLWGRSRRAQPHLSARLNSRLSGRGLAALLAGLLPVAALAAQKADLSLGRPQGSDADLTLALTGEQRAAALAHYSIALQLEDAGKSREALAHYREVIKADPSNASLVAHTAEVAMNFGSRDEALAILRESIKANPGSPQPYLSLARFLTTYAADDPFEKENAAGAIAEALKRFPQNAAVYRDAVMMHLTRGDARDQAVKVLEQALKQPSSDPAFWLAVGRVAQEVWPLGQQENRQQNRERVNPFFEKTLRSAGTDASGAEARLQVAQYYMLSNQLPEATALCEKLVAGPGSGQARKLLFRLYEAAGKNDLAYTTLQNIVKENPGDVEQRKLLAEFCEQRQDYPQAVTHLEAAIQTGGGDAQEYSNLAKLMLQGQMYDRLITLSQRTTTLFPEQLEFRVYAGMAYRAQKRWDDAIKHFEKAEQVAAGMAGEPRLNFFFYYQYGITLERAGRLDEGSKRLEKSIELTPKENAEFAANTMNYLGYMWIEQGRNLDKAGELIGKANELEPNNAAFIDSLGWLHFKKGDYKAALTELLRARELLKELQPEDAEIVDHIGQAWQKLGDKEKAIENFKKAHELDPSNQKIKERLDEALGKPKQELPKPKTEESPPEKKPGQK